MKFTNFLLISLLISTNLFAGQFSSKTAGLVAYYPLNWAAVDNTSNSNGITSGGWVTGLIDGAAYFDGTTYITVYNKPILSLTNMTISLWVYGTAATWGNYNTLISNGRNISGSIQNFWIDTNAVGASGGKCRFNYQISPQTYGTGLNMNSAIPSRKWTMVTLTMGLTGATTTQYIKFYINDTLDASGIGNGVPAATANNLYIGAEYGTGIEFLFTGYIDDVKLYNRVLTAGEIKDIYNTQLRGKKKWQPEQ